MSQYYQYDVLIIGSGAAGLTTALTLPKHVRIAVLSKGDLSAAPLFGRKAVWRVYSMTLTRSNHTFKTH